MPSPPPPPQGLRRPRGLGRGVHGGLQEWPPGRLRGRRRPTSRARPGSRGGLCPTVQEHQCARPGGIACGRAWLHGDREASSAMAPENDMKGNSVTIHAKFARNSCEICESACLTEYEAFANAQHNLAKFARTSREYGVEDNGYVTFTRAGHCPRPFLALLCPLPRRLSVQYSPKCPRHLHVPVR